MGAVYDMFLAEYIVFRETVILAPIYRNFSDTITFTENFHQNHPPGTEGDTLGLYDSAVRRVTHNRYASDTLVFRETSYPRVHVAYLTDTLTLSENFYDEKLHRTDTDVLSFTETATFQLINPVDDVLVFTESFSYTRTHNKSLTDTLVLSEGFGCTTPSGWVAPAAFDVSFASTVLFQYGSRTVTLRNYEFGNAEDLSFTRVSRRSRGGDFEVGPSVLHTETFVVTFFIFTEALQQEFQQFIQDTVGRTITFKDHENVWWSGYIVEPNTPFIQSSLSTYTVTIKFEGTKV